jgi:hypothetical protein
MLVYLRKLLSGRRLVWLLWCSLALASLKVLLGNCLLSLKHHLFLLLLIHLLWRRKCWLTDDMWRNLRGTKLPHLGLLGRMDRSGTIALRVRSASLLVCWRRRRYAVLCGRVSRWLGGNVCYSGEILS